MATKTELGRYFVETHHRKTETIVEAYEGGFKAIGEYHIAQLDLLSEMSTAFGLDKITKDGFFVDRRYVEIAQIEAQRRANQK
jgi:hypothetical protein